MTAARLAKKGVTKGLSAFGRAREGGVCGNPTGPDILAMTTVSIGGLQFDLATPLVGSIWEFDFPRCRATLPSEDLATCAPGTSPYADLGPPC